MWLGDLDPNGIVGQKYLYNGPDLRVLINSLSLPLVVWQNWSITSIQSIRCVQGACIREVHEPRSMSKKLEDEVLNGASFREVMLPGVST